MKARIAIVALLSLSSCGDDDDGGDMPDAQAQCEEHADCDDGVFCNGVEQCESSSEDADELGCVAGEPPCAEGEACDETPRECVDQCLEADADGDGHDSMDCGGDDCDDSNALRFPGNTEVCDVDNVDEDCDPRTFGFRDADMDGEADAACCNEDAGEMVCGRDCDDAAAGTGPSATESCDGADNDCDGETDEGVKTTCYTDDDRDGYAPDGALSMEVCGCPDGTTSVAPDDGDTDCDDASSSISPSEAEVCNAIDDDCDDATDEGLTLVARYIDEDGDGFEGTSVDRCEGDPNSAATSRDCDDDDPDTYEGAAEICNRIDNDCSSGGGVDASEDSDEDGHAPIVSLCSGGLPVDDCDDNNAQVFPGAAELCDGLDNDCSGNTDERSETDLVCDASVDSGAAVCISAACHLATCPPAMMDCNGELADGCETDILSSSANCGGCGQQCLGACEGGRCSVRPAQIATGNQHACARLDDGTVACWGYASTDGIPSTETYVPELIGVTGAEDLFAGSNHACARLSDGSLICWGQNRQGQVGAGHLDPAVQTPAVVTGIMGSTLSDGGSSHTCVPLGNGTVRCWGSNGDGELGDNVSDHGFGAQCAFGSDCSPTPVVVSGLSNIESVALGEGFSCGLDGTGAAHCWGVGSFGQLGHSMQSSSPIPVAVAGGHSFTEISSGRWHSCGRLVDGTVRCWGFNSAEQLGDGSTSIRSAPVAVVGLSGVAHVAVGADTSCALLNEGTAQCWGSNTSGQIGDGTMTGRGSPTFVTDVVDGSEISVGGTFACVRRVDGSVSCWGNGVALGSGTNLDRALSGPVLNMNVPVQIEVGSGSACGLRASGDLWCWGANSFGELGNGSFDGMGGALSWEPLPQRVVGNADFAHVSLGAVSCGIRSNGTVSCWGSAGPAGRLGDGSTSVSHNTPQPVTGISNAIALDAGEHSCAVLADGSVMCWGDNQFGQVGVTGQPQPIPVAVPDVSGAIAVAVSQRASCALLDGGDVDCWGLGANSAEMLSAIRQLDAGEFHFCGIRADGQVLCTGTNADGQLGDATTDDATSPIEVPGMTNIRQIALGANYSCALNADGEVFCWGEDMNTAFGLGTGDALSPIQLPDVDDGVTMGAGPYSACVLRANGRTVCWGLSGQGVLGQGAETAGPVQAIWH